MKNKDDKIIIKNKIIIKDDVKKKLKVENRSDKKNSN